MLRTLLYANIFKKINKWNTISCRFAQSVLQEELVQNVKSVLMDIMVIQRVFMELQDPVFSVNAMEILI